MGSPTIKHYISNALITISVVVQPLLNSVEGNVLSRIAIEKAEVAAKIRHEIGWPLNNRCVPF